MPMWMSVDRIEKDLVILIADDETVYHVKVADYETLVGRPPQETHMLWTEIGDGNLLSACYDPEETARRLQAAKDRLQRLLRKKKT